MFQALFQGIKESASFHKACPYRELSFVGRQVRAMLCNVLNGTTILLPACFVTWSGARLHASIWALYVLLWRSRRGA